ncbi:TPA: hypothetical protein P2Q98_000617 [Aeromonas veronii]|uniref:hypothetical protein n=1 Tax=Aeromonas veronii TaxID=654 RepID=UPI00330EAA60|nr:hypothetical protein [Aeromonas veronii]HDO1332502.1 hypothetical protein [Aeromonas veronii]HDO1339700.1 hypothetical protein [Aeromonas veronii]HDO1343167.1 hypothetical protein [Aeromonas veronii]HDO1347515.1 hypothetical protein [Aeromonas veronii]
MTPQEIKKIIEHLTLGDFSSPWLLYVLLAFLSTMFAAFMGAYLNAKANNLATREDFERVLSQLKAQIKVTEEIKSEVLFNSWTLQERNKTLRVKIEELVNCTFELRRLAKEDLEKLGNNIGEMSSVQFDTESDAILKMEMLSKLYFPELNVFSLEVNLNFRLLQNEVRQSNIIAQEIIEKRANAPLLPSDIEKIKERNDKIPALHKNLTDSIDMLVGNAKSVLDVTFEKTCRFD